MRILILGGTLFLGRHVVDACLARGHRVTLFNRGTRPAPSSVEQIRGDRDGGLDALKDGRWDAVIDPSGYVPRLVGASARMLADRVGHYTFVSSASVYADLSRPTIDEHETVATMPDAASEDVPSRYGALKALSERAAEAAMPGRVLHVRAGLIVGPFDVTGRFAYWVRRAADGGEILAPGAPDRPVQFVHARDLADWIVAMAEAGAAGVFNATGPATTLTMAQLLDACRVPGRDVRCTWVDDDFLEAHDVAPFTEMPLWLPPEAAGLLKLDVSKALAAGLRFRPIVDTVADVAGALVSPVEPPARLASGAPTRAGMVPERERALLAAWHAAGTASA